MNRALLAVRSVSALAVLALFVYIVAPSMGPVFAPLASALESAPTCKGQTATIWVNSSNKIVGGDDDGDTYAGVLDGTNFADVIVGTSGADDIDGGNGEDVICGGEGNDEINGGNNDDYLCGENGNDTIDGGTGADHLCGDAGNDTIDGGTGEDEIDGGADTDTLIGGTGTQDICVNGETVTKCETTTGTVSCTPGASSSSASSVSSAASSVSSVSSISSSSVMSSAASVSSVSSVSSAASSVSSASSDASVSSVSSIASSAASSVSSSSVSSVVSSVSSSVSSAAIVACPASDLEGYWKFDENSGIIAMDSSGELHHALHQNGPVYTAGTPAVSGNVSALQFDGDDSRVWTSGSDFEFDNDEFSVSAFVKTGSGNRAVLGHFDNNGEGHRGWGLYLHSTNRVNFFGYGDNGTNDVSHAATVLDNAWHNITGVYSRNGAALTIDTYVDGVLAGSHTTNVGDISVTTNMLLGDYELQPNFAGVLDEVRVYSRELSAAEVAGCAGLSASSSSASSVSSVSSTSSAVSSSVSSAASTSSVSSTASSSSAPAAPVFQGVSTPDANGSSGAYRGKRTNTIAAVADFLAGMFLGEQDDVASGAFGGARTVRFSEEEKELLCSMKRSMPRNAGRTMIDWTADYLATLMNRDADMIADALRDAALCGVTEAKATVAVASAKPFKVDVFGNPVSSNLTWNACVAGNVTLAQIRANTDKDKNGNARDCGYYHTSGLWKHPDLGIHFAWNRKTKEIQLPAGYAVVEDTLVTQR